MIVIGLEMSSCWSLWCWKENKRLNLSFLFILFSDSGRLLLLNLKASEDGLLMKLGLVVSWTQCDRQKRRGESELVFISGRIFQVFRFRRSARRMF